MNGVEYDITVTSPNHRWLGTSLERQHPPLLAVLVGKNTVQTRVPTNESSEQSELVERIRKESLEQDIVALFFERHEGVWRDVPTHKLGTSIYKVSGVLGSNFFNAIRCCETTEEQRDFLALIGLAIDDQFIGC